MTELLGEFSLYPVHFDAPKLEHLTLYCLTTEDAKIIQDIPASDRTKKHEMATKEAISLQRTVEIYFSKFVSYHDIKFDSKNVRKLYIKIDELKLPKELQKSNYFKNLIIFTKNIFYSISRTQGRR